MRVASDCENEPSAMSSYEEAAQPPPRFAVLARHSMVFSVGPAIGKATAILTLPVLTRILGPSRFGVLDVLSTMVSAVISILLLGIDVAAIRSYADHDDTRRREHHATWLAIATLTVVPIGLLAVALRDQLSNALFGTALYGTAIAFGAIAVIFGTYQYLIGTLLQLKRRPWAYAFVIGGTLVLNAALAILFVLRARSVASVMLAMAVSLFVGAIAGGFVARHEFWGRPTRPAARSLFVLGLPLVPAATLMWSAEFLNRFVVLNTSGARQVGFFSVGIRFASIAALVVAGFQLAWQPHAYEIAAEGGDLRRIGTEAVRIVASVAGVTAAIALISPELVRLVSGPAFAPAVRAVGGCLVAVLGSAVFLAAVMPSAVARNMKKVGLATGTISCASVLGVVILSPALGAFGAALATALGQIVGVVVAYACGRNDAPLGLHWLRMTLLWIASGAVALAATSDTVLSQPASRVALGLAFAVFLAAEGSLGLAWRFAKQVSTLRGGNRSSAGDGANGQHPPDSPES
jgi:O-antigen/teichoic acid export membrane protein